MNEFSQKNDIFLCSCGQPSILNRYVTPSVSVVKKRKQNGNKQRDSSADTNNLLQEKIKEEFLHFCYNSTIRGVPRIAKSRNTKLRIIWLLSFITLVVGLGACVYYLGRQFLEYNVIHPPRVLRDVESDFPSLTVCNSRPLSSEGKNIIENNNWRKPNEFSSNINQWAIRHFYYKNRIRDYMLLTTAMQLSTYIESLPTDEDRSNLGHSRESFVIYCQVSYVNGSKPIARPCKEVGTWNEYLHAFYIKCATFNLHKDYRKVTKTIEMYLYLQEPMDEISCLDCNRYDIKSQISGAVLGIDRPDTFSNINDKSIILMPGTLTEIRLKTFQNIQKAPPYGNCSVDTPKFLKLFDKEFEYSETGCKQATIQADIQQNCKCVAVEYPFNNGTLPFCTTMTPFLRRSDCDMQKNVDNTTCIETMEKVLKNLECKNKVTIKYYQDYIKNCTLPCSFLSYESDRSTSKWPTKSYQLTLFDHKVFKHNRLISKPEFEPYRQMKTLSAKGQIKEASKILENTNVLERNLLAMLIDKPNFNLHKVEEKEVLSLTSFLSQIGGLCSIWIGLTLISIVEIVEMLLQSFEIIFAKPKPSPQTSNKTCSNNDDNQYLEPLQNDHHITFKSNVQTDPSEIPLHHSYSLFIASILKCDKCNSETIL